MSNPRPPFQNFILNFHRKSPQLHCLPKSSSNFPLSTSTGRRRTTSENMKSGDAIFFSRTQFWLKSSRNFEPTLELFSAIHHEIDVGGRDGRRLEWKDEGGVGGNCSIWLTFFSIQEPQVWELLSTNFHETFYSPIHCCSDHINPMSFAQFEFNFSSSFHTF